MPRARRSGSSVGAWDVRNSCFLIFLAASAVPPPIVILVSPLLWLSSFDLTFLLSSLSAAEARWLLRAETRFSSLGGMAMILLTEELLSRGGTKTAER